MSKLSDALAARCAELEAKWISIKERLPELWTEVLVSNANGISSDEREPEIATLHEDGEFYFIAPWNFNLYAKAKVTHWMPLPEPPDILGEKKE